MLAKFIGFHVGAARALHTGHLPASVTAAWSRQRGHDSVVTTGGTARKTYRKRGSVGVLLARGPGVDRWSVTDYQAMKKPLKGC